MSYGDPNTPEAKGFGYEVVNAARLDIADLSVPELVDILDVWKSARKREPDGAIAPTPKGFALHRLPPKIIPNAVMVDIVSDEPFDVRYRFFGTAWVTRIGFDVTGRRHFADGVRNYGNVIVEAFERVARSKEPDAGRTQWRTSKGLMAIATALRLPLSSDGTTVDRAISLSVFERDA